MKTLIIAEAGVNHNGNIEIAKQLIRVAADAGADIVKFQSFKTESSISKNAPKANYQIAATGMADNQYEMVKNLELSAGEHAELIDECPSRPALLFYQQHLILKVLICSWNLASAT